ncbi:MAG TPA: aminotransferase class IV [Acidobacteriota bacterium]|jgi:branched-chain amino acid aminotransferase
MKINVDGIVYDPERARISVLDHGFLYGDSVYEVLRTRAGMLENFDEHFARLENSARFIHLQLPHNAAFYRQEIEKTCSALGATEASIRWIVTRGPGELSLSPLETEPGFVIIAQRLQANIIPPLVKLVIVRGMSSNQLGFDPRIKTGNRLPHVLAMYEVKQAGGYEGLLKTAEGILAEGITSSLFFVRGNLLLTPSLETGILNGVTRRQVLKAANEAGIPAQEGKFTEQDLLAADAVFICSSTRGIVPADQVDHHPYASRSNSILKRLYQKLE